MTRSHLHSQFSLQEEANDAVEKILALRALTASTGTRTTKTQNDLLQSLPNEVLTLVAVQLKQHSRSRG